MIPVNIGQGDQFKPEFLEISPNNRMPAIVDHDVDGDPISVFESGAILIYLAEKTGRFLPAEGEARARTMEWLMFQMGGVGPMLGQAHHFVKFNPDVSEYARDRYAKEAKRLYGVLDKRLGDAEYMAGDEYSIADIATWPWISRFEWQGIDMNEFPNVRRWYLDIAARDARAAKARRRLRSLSERSPARIGRATWRRDDLHDR